MSTRTVLITGTSSGIGRATARHFAQNGWNVAATMRSPEKETELGTLPNTRLYRLDVTDIPSIEAAIAAAVRDFGTIHAVVNNAGYGAAGIFEKSTPEQMQQQFATNVFGVMNVTRAVLPVFRQARKGTIINITSMGGRVAFPLYSAYHATKWSLEGFGESLMYELKPLGIRVKHIEPGNIRTEFTGRSMERFEKPGMEDYRAYEEVLLTNIVREAKKGSDPAVVARKVLQAANDPTWRLRYPVAYPAPLLLAMKRLIPLSWFSGMIRTLVAKGAPQ
jgi:NAD(P)-dependent dehydrogenase (short-subunit alcohol dehydrogenase family)